MNRLTALVTGLTLLLQALPAMAISTQQSKPKTFAQWCQQRNSVPAATKLTIDLLLKQALKWLMLNDLSNTFAGGLLSESIAY